MSRATFRNRSWWAAVGLALAVGLTAAGAARGSEVAPRMAVLPDGSIVELTCVAAGAWVDAHPDALPRTYADFSRFPLLYRKAIYADLPAAVQVDLWQRHLEVALATHDLTPSQVEFVRRAQANVPMYLALGPSDEAKALETEARASLGDDLTRLLFSVIGPVSPMIEEACSCSQESDFCPDGFQCGEDSDGCIEIPNECGALWLYDCDGECLLPIAPSS